MIACRSCILRLLVSVLLWLVGFSSSAEVLLSDTFVVGERLTQNLPNTAAWYTAYASSGISDSSGELVSSDNRHALAYFTDSGSPQNLDVGDSLTATFRFSLDTPVASTTGFRVGLFNSGGSRVSADNAGASAAIFSNYTGYASFLNLQSSTALRIEARYSGLSSKLIHSGDAYADLTGDQGEGTTFVSAQEYDATLTLRRISSGMTVSVSLSGADGYAAEYSDYVADGETAFDTFVIYGAGSAVDGYALQAVDVSYLAYTDVLLLETFVSGERLTQNLPSTAAWYTAYASSGINDSSGELVSSDNRHTLAYFTASGDPLTLCPGETLTANILFSIDTPAVSTTGLRFGLLNSGGVRVSADNAGSSASAFLDYTGYAAFLNLQASSALRIEERSGGLSSKLIHSNDSFADLTGDQGTGTTFVSGQEYNLIISLSRTDAGMEISATLNGEDDYAVTCTDTNGDVEVAFDTFVLYGAGAALDGYTLTSVDIYRNPYDRVAANATYGCRRPHGYGLYDETVNKTFVCWNGPSMNIYGKAYDHDDNEWSAEQLITTQTFTGSWIYHNYPNMTQAPDGRLIVAWAAHTGYMNFARSAQPHDLSGTWDKSIVSINDNAYPMIFTYDDTIYIFYSVDNDSSWPYRSFGYIQSTDNGDTWTPHARAIDSEKQDPGCFDEVYAFHYHMEPAEDRIHFSWLMRGGPNGHNQGSRNAYFAYFIPATATWESVGGTDLGDWIDFDEMLAHCLVWDTGAVDSGYPINKIMSTSFDDGTPMVVYNLNGPAQQAVWSGSQWQTNQISTSSASAIRSMPDGSQRVALTPSGQPSLEIVRLAAKGGSWQSVFSDAIPYENGANRSWSIGFIDEGRPEVDLLISQIDSSEETVDYSGKWPVWSVDTRFGE